MLSSEGTEIHRRFRFEMFNIGNANRKGDHLNHLHFSIPLPPLLNVLYLIGAVDLTIAKKFLAASLFSRIVNVIRLEFIC